MIDGRPQEGAASLSTSRTLGKALAFAAVYLIWGSTYLAIKVAIETVPPLLMAGTRFLIAGVPLFLWLRTRGVPGPTRANWRATAVVGALMLMGGNGLVTVSEQLVPSSLAAVLVAMVPLWMTALDRWFFRGPRLTRTVILGLVLGFTGVAVLVNPFHAGGAAVNPVGALLLVVAAGSWGLGSLRSRGASLPRSPLMAVAMEMMAGGALLVAVSGLRGEWSRLDPAAVSGRSALALLYLAVFGSIVALNAYSWLLRVSSASSVSTYAFVNPVVAVVLGWAILGEALTARTALASAFILAAVLIILWSRARERAPGDRFPAQRFWSRRSQPRNQEVSPRTSAPTNALPNPATEKPGTSHAARANRIAFRTK